MSFRALRAARFSAITFSVAKRLPGARANTLSRCSGKALNLGPLDWKDDEAIQAVADFCKAAKMHKRIASLVSLALDELLMNAIYDAQIDDLGRLVHKKTPRHTVFPLEGPSAVEFHLGYNGQVLGVTVVDNWGSLEKPELLTHLLKSYQGTNYEARASQVSAGLGLGSLCRAGANLYFASESRVRTEVSALFRCSDGYREFRGQTRFVSAQFYF